MIFHPRVRLSLKEQLLPDVFRMRFESPQIARQAQPGNFVQIKVDPGYDPIFRRPMSIHTCEDDSFEVVFRTVGRGTHLLAQTEEGAWLDFVGPLGNTFDLPQPGERVVLVSGGIGFPPLHFFARRLLEQRKLEAKQIVFLFGIRNRSEAILAADIRKLGLEPCLSTDDGSLGFHGLVTQLLEKLYHKSLTGDRLKLYACGPQPMLRRMTELAAQWNLPCRLSLEGHMPCGVGTCLGCVVKKRGENDYHRICYEGPVFDAQEVEL